MVYWDGYVRHKSYYRTQRVICWDGDVRHKSNHRTQRVVVETAMSDTSPIYCGVPQCSVLEPALFCMHTMPLEDIIFHHGLLYVMYADDIQLYITCDGDQVPTGTVKEGVGEIRN